MASTSSPARASACAAIAIAGAAAAWTGPGLAPLVPSVARALRVPRRLAAPGAVAITFDDGPDPAGTPAVLEALAARGASATFLLVGEQVDRDGALAAEIVAAGHTVGVHGYRHRNMQRLTPAGFAADLERGLGTIAEATGTAPRIYRPPYGIFTPPGLRTVRARGLAPLLWSKWGHDWRRRATAASIAREVTEDVGAGDVLLLHDADHYSASGSWRATAESLPRVLDAIEAAGLGTIPL